MCMIKTPMFCCDFLYFSQAVFDWGSTKTHPFFRNPGIAKVLAVERDVKSRNMNFAKLERGWGGGVNREWVFVQINMVTLYLVDLRVLPFCLQAYFTQKYMVLLKFEVVLEK